MTDVERNPIRAVHEDIVADRTVRFIAKCWSKPGGHHFQSEATTRFLTDFKQYFGKEAYVVMRRLDLVGEGDSSQRYERVARLNGTLVGADQYSLKIDAQDGELTDSLGGKAAMPPRHYDFPYAIHRGDAKTQKTESSQIEAVVVDGQNVIPDFNRDEGGQTPLELFLQSAESMATP